MSSVLSVRLGAARRASVPALPRTALYSAIEQGLHAPAPVVTRRSASRLGSLALSAALGLSALSAAGPLQAATITVDTTADAMAVDGGCSLREAVANANQDSDLTGGECVAGASGLDTIVFDPALLPATITLAGGQLDVDQPLAITGPGSGALSLYAGVDARHIQASAPLTLSGLAINRGVPDVGYGGAVLASSDLTVTDCTFAYNEAAVGGALSNRYGGAARGAKGATLPVAWAISGTEFRGNRADASFGDALGGAVGFFSYAEGDSVSIGNSAAGGSEFVGNRAYGSLQQAKGLGGRSSLGGGVFIGSYGDGLSVDLTDVVFEENAADSGGGAAIFASTVTVTGGAFYDNDALYSGGGALLGESKYRQPRAALRGAGTPLASKGGAIGSLSLDGTVFYGNQARYAAGAEITGSAIVATGLEVVGNATVRSYARAKGLGCGGEEAGGMRFGVADSLTISGSRFAYNCAGGDGGGAAILLGPGATASVAADTVFENNVADSDNGGLGVYLLAQSSATISGSFVDNRAYDEGGGLGVVIYGDASAVLDGIEARGNEARSYGGGVRIEADVAYSSVSGASITIQASTIAANTVSEQGGGIAVDLDGYSYTYAYVPGYGGYGSYRIAEHSLTISSTVVSDNTADSNGGGLFLEGTYVGDLTATGSTFSGNRSAYADGGGMALRIGFGGFDSLAIAGSTISGNSAVQGGGLYLDLYGGNTATLANSTVHGNTAAPAQFAKGGSLPSGSGGGIALYAGYLQLELATITGNTAAEGGGLAVENSASATLRNSIVADNTASTSAPDILGAVYADFVLVEDASGATISGADNTIGVDPLLGPLQDNGGPTLTRLPLAGSPAIGTGDPAFAPPPDTDQRGVGFPRVNGVLDKGAVETPAQVVGLAISPDPFAEGTGSTLTVMLDAATAQAAVVTVAFSGTAVLDTDFSSVDADAGTAGVQVAIAAGSSSGSATITGLADATDEPDEDLTATVTAASGAGFTGTIADSAVLTDADPLPAVGIDDVTVAEGGTASFTLTLANASSQTVSVGFATAAGSAEAGQDFTGVSGSVDFAPGVLSQAVAVSTLDDALVEAAETFTVDLSAPVNATLADAQGMGTITDTDAGPMVTLSMDQASIVEEGGSTSITATLSMAAAQDVTITLGFSGTAVQGTDYSVGATQIVIPAGLTSGSVLLSTIDDGLDEGDETVVVDILAVSNGQESGTQQGAVVIDDTADGTASGGPPPAQPQPVIIPTLSEWMLLLLGLLLPATVIGRLRRRQPETLRHN